ncbi:MAG: 3-hydroxy-3-methylglutaryl-CoA reductase [Candidatus Aenigmarchaeota archaeon]|nr:3-hydroxy-3-methylglutaryl-CoA reductase [Candidatus Aenigmarchaeota archaeon]
MTDLKEPALEKVLESIKKDFQLGKIKPYLLEEKIFESCNNWELSNKLATEWRLETIENNTGKTFPSIKNAYVKVCKNHSSTKTTGIEQQIGGCITPLGISTPLKINGEYAKGNFVLPLATNEAALIAGINRGIKILNEAGGVNTVVVKDCMTRAPLVECSDIKEAKMLYDEIKNKGYLYKLLKQAAEEESKVSVVKEMIPFQQGRFLHIRFGFETGDSMGMNSATKYSANAIKALIERHPDVKIRSLTANMCSDKKATHTNIIFGRGKSIETEIFIKASLIKKHFGIDAETVAKLNYLKNYRGSALAGTTSGFNANAANTIAAFFVATGQDCAQLTESSSCFIDAEIIEKDGEKYLAFGASLPCLEVATLGGGTEFGTAKECLDIIGCAGAGISPGDNARKLAEIIAAAVTAQDLNLLCAQANTYELAESHIRLARGE